MTRLKPDARALLQKLITVKVLPEPTISIREVGRTSDRKAFIKKENNVIQRVDGDADAVLKMIIRRAPDIAAFYATTIPHLIQIMRSNSDLFRSKEKPSIETATASPKRVRKKKRHK